MKNNKIIILGIILTILIISVFIFLLIKDNMKLSYPIKDNPNQENKQQTLKEFVESKEGQELSMTLATYGYEIFQKKTYLNYSKSDEGVYYLTKKELTDLGYDLSTLDPNCNDEAVIMFISADENGNSTNNQELPVRFIMSCTLE